MFSDGTAEYQSSKHGDGMKNELPVTGRCSQCFKVFGALAGPDSAIVRADNAIPKANGPSDVQKQLRAQVACPIRV